MSLVLEASFAAAELKHIRPKIEPISETFHTLLAKRFAGWSGMSGPFLTAGTQDYPVLVQTQRFISHAYRAAP